MQLVDLPNNESRPAAKIAAETFLTRLNTELSNRARFHIASFKEFWDNSLATPDEILEAMGSRAALWLACAAESVDHINRLAALVGKNVADFIPAEQFTPRRAFVPSDGGKVTLAPPAEGFDAHGLPI